MKANIHHCCSNLALLACIKDPINNLPFVFVSACSVDYQSFVCSDDWTHSTRIVSQIPCLYGCLQVLNSCFCLAYKLSHHQDEQRGWVSCFHVLSNWNFFILFSSFFIQIACFYLHCIGKKVTWVECGGSRHYLDGKSEILFLKLVPKYNGLAKLWTLVIYLMIHCELQGDLTIILWWLLSSPLKKDCFLIPHKT